MQIISGMWPTQKQPQHAYVLGNRNYSYWSASFKSLCSHWVSTERSIFGYSWVLWDWIWKGQPTLAYMKWIQYWGCSHHFSEVLSSAVSTSSNSSPWLQKPLCFPKSGLILHALLVSCLLVCFSWQSFYTYQTVIKAAVPINYSNWIWCPSHTHHKGYAHIYIHTLK